MNSETKHEPTDFDKAVYARLQSLVQSTNLYKEDNMNLAEVADLLAVTPRELSEAINRSVNMTFPMYIRQYRVNEAKRLLALSDHQVMSITEIGFEAGFSNKSTFNYSFKMLTNLTPSDFRQSVLSEKLH